MPLFSITTLSQFKIMYFIKADTVEEAIEELSTNPDLVEASQEHLGESVFDVHQLSRKKFDKWLAAEMEDPSGYVQTWLGERLINVVPSEETPTYYSAAMDKMSQSLQMGTPETEEPFDDGGPYYGAADPFYVSQGD